MFELGQEVKRCRKINAMVQPGVCDASMWLGSGCYLPWFLSLQELGGAVDPMFRGSLGNEAVVSYVTYVVVELSGLLGTVSRLA